MIRTIEELSMNAWPAWQTILLDGWVLRFAGGYTRRANSVTALYPPQSRPEPKIQQCEALYRDRGLPVIFKLPGRQESLEFDTLLEQQGYAAEAQTSVQTLALAAYEARPNSRVHLSAVGNAGWNSAFARLSGLNERQQAAHHQILTLILPQTCYAAVMVEDRVAACGLGVLQSGCLGIFDVVVDASCRRQGYGECLMHGLLDFGKQHGAHTAYLQVMLNNPPALAMYEKLGFAEIYQYWYRVKR